MCVPTEQVDLAARMSEEERRAAIQLQAAARAEEEAEERRLWLEAKLWDRYGQGKLW